MDDEQDNLPTMICPSCGGIMQLIGVEQDETDDELERHIPTFECSRGHYEAVTFPKPN